MNHVSNSNHQMMIIVLNEWYLENVHVQRCFWIESSASNMYSIIYTLITLTSATLSISGIRSLMIRKCYDKVYRRNTTRETIPADLTVKNGKPSPPVYLPRWIGSDSGNQRKHELYIKMIVLVLSSGGNCLGCHNSNNSMIHSVSFQSYGNIRECWSWSWVEQEASEGSQDWI